MQLAADIADEATKPLTESELKTAVNSRAAQIGTPLVQISEGSIILRLSLGATVGVPVLAALGFLLQQGPEIAALPNKIRERWYSSAEDAFHARNSYERLKQRSLTTVIGPALDHIDKISGEQVPPTPTTLEA